MNSFIILEFSAIAENFSCIIMRQLGNERKWKAQTVTSLMLRLVERGFIRTEKAGKERTYFPLIGKEDYLKSDGSQVNFGKPHMKQLQLILPS
jgi:predicted transcriptional regulator